MADLPSVAQKLTDGQINFNKPCSQQTFATMGSSINYILDNLGITNSQTFLAGSNFTAVAGVTQYGVLASGGGGAGGAGYDGVDHGGEGGCGAVPTFHSVSLVPGNTYAVGIGAGGAPVAGSGNLGGDGFQSSLSGNGVGFFWPGARGGNKQWISHTAPGSQVGAVVVPDAWYSSYDPNMFVNVLSDNANQAEVFYKNRLATIPLNAQVPGLQATAGGYGRWGTGGVSYDGQDSHYAIGGASGSTSDDHGGGGGAGLGVGGSGATTPTNQGTGGIGAGGGGGYVNGLAGGAGGPGFMTIFW